MDIKNNALIISDQSDFTAKYLKLLQRNKFKVFKVKDVHHWNDDQKKIDICLIDNTNGGFNFEEFFKKVDNLSSNTLVISVSNNHKQIQNNHALVYHLNPDSESIDLDVFIKNINHILERDKARTELAATLLHDLRSPMNSLITYMELLLNETFGDLNEGQKNFMEKAMVLGDQILDMLEEINEVYQNEQYSFHLEKEYFTLSNILDEALLKIWIQADAKRIKIKKDLRQNLPQIYGDPFQIQRVFINLIGNSIKYCPPDSRIVIKASSKDKSIEIEISDNGGGISESQLKKVFRKFYRADQHIQLKKGQGLGLYISRLIVKAHKGKIRAENNNIGGLSFIFTLPTSK